MARREELRPAARLLVESVAPAPGDGTAVERALRGVDVPAVAEAAFEHRVLPALSRLLVDAPGMSSAWRPAMRTARREQAVRHLRVVAEAVSLGEVLDGIGVPWVVAKGPVAASALWPAADMRQYYDLDLYVPRRDFARAAGALEAAGCSEVDRNWPLMRSEMRAEYGLLAPGGTHVDLHWDIAVPPELRAAYRTNLDAMIARRRLVDVGGGRRLWTFDVEDSALLLAFHAAQAGANKLVWLADVRFALLDPSFDPDLFAERVRAVRASVPVALVVDRAERVLGLSPDLRDRLRPLVRRAGVLGRAARLQDRRLPFPGLPGDRHLGGAVYAGARPTVPASVVCMVRSRTRLRAIERAVLADPRAAEKELRIDVPDAAAKAEYLARSSQVTAR